MKITILKNNLTNQETITKGLALVRSWTDSIGFPLDISVKDSTFKYTTTTVNTTLGNIPCVVPEQILSQVTGTEDVACLIFNNSAMTPKPINPMQHPLKKGNATPIQMCEQWYGVKYEETFASYLLHEILHAMYFLLGKSSQDRTHYKYQDASFGQKQDYEWYLKLMNELKSDWNKYKTVSTGYLEPVYPASVLRVGSKGDKVKTLQLDLNKLMGSNLKVDGDFGNITKNAVMDFQKTYRLVADGLVGNKTQTKMTELKNKMDSIAKFGLLPVVARKAVELLDLCVANNIPMRITSGYRSFEEQNKLYAQGRTAPGNIVTKAKAGDSLHNYRVAFDVVFANGSYTGNWALYGKLAKQVGFEWGGDWVSFPDRPHTQYLMGYTLSSFRQNKVDLTKFN